VKLLLDSHAYLWWLLDDPRLPPAAREAIAGPKAAVHVSPATVWELSIKAALGKLDLDGVDLAAEIAANRFEALPITARHAQAAAFLPRHHDDPFDRMLVAQARLESLAVVTRDATFAAYGLQVLWS
jgi:PIN domain nuclease of toxin-antitoxin system